MLLNEKPRWQVELSDFGGALVVSFVAEPHQITLPRNTVQQPTFEHQKLQQYQTTTTPMPMPNKE